MRAHALLLVLAPAIASADRAWVKGACAGCVATAPSSAAPAALLVLLHGDGETPSRVHGAWERHAAERGVALLALPCPEELGCKGSFWRWTGEPSFITAAVAAFSKLHAIDRARTFIAGWSGGASYIGLHTRELERGFSAIVIHGGGVPPSSGTCGDPKRAVVFLSGDRNPLHGLALGLRDHYARCGNEVAFHLLPGADHAREWSALDAWGGVVLDELLARAARAPSP